jgi:hypothetical protein
MEHMESACDRSSTVEESRLQRSEILRQYRVMNRKQKNKKKEIFEKKIKYQKYNNIH